MSEQAEMSDALRRAIRKAGGAVRIGSKLGITAQAIYQWKICPPFRVLDLERLSGVSRTDLRPDLYPLPPLSSVRSLAEERAR